MRGIKTLQYHSNLEDDLDKAKAVLEASYASGIIPEIADILNRRFEELI